MPRRLIWALIALLVLFLIIAPIASYCLGRDQDYREYERAQGASTSPRQSAVVTGPLIR